MMSTFSKQLHIKQTWDGKQVPVADQLNLFFSLDTKQFTFRVEAPFYGDVAPSGVLGFTDKLWEYEVVELFLLGVSGQYLEIELGPHGHYLLYLLTDVRQVLKTIEPLSVSCTIKDASWQGEITIATGDIPENIVAINGYGIHGQGSSRRYVAMSPVSGESPDFHQLDVFLPLTQVPDWNLS